MTLYDNINLVNNGPGDRRVPNGTKPLPALMMIFISEFMWHSHERIFQASGLTTTIEYDNFENYTFENYCHIYDEVARFRVASQIILKDSSKDGFRPLSAKVWNIWKAPWKHSFWHLVWKKWLGTNLKQVLWFKCNSHTWCHGRQMRFAICDVKDTQ